MKVQVTNAAPTVCGGAVCTPNGFAMKARIERLKRELKANQSRGFRKW